MFTAESGDRVSVCNTAAGEGAAIVVAGPFSRPVPHAITPSPHSVAANQHSFTIISPPRYSQQTAGGVVAGLYQLAFGEVARSIT
jgi:hypothetical protein